MTIAQKRSQLFREWLLATLGNDESYYCSTLALGIPDGDDEETVMEDLKDGFYDEDIDEMIDVYLRAKRRYAKHGYYVKHQLVFTEEEALKLAGHEVPERIYKKRSGKW